MLLKTPDVLLTEVRELIADRGPAFRASIRGRLWALEKGLELSGTTVPSQNLWILRAQLGTLDKLDSLFGRDRVEGTFELLGIARNLFENLVWLRLFNQDGRYGIVFYRQLLDQQKQNTERMISKIAAEAELFDRHSIEDHRALEETVMQAIRDGADEEAVLAAKAVHGVRVAELDKEVRRSFALYGAAATFNSYAYQAHIIREKIIPKHRDDLAAIQTEIDLLVPRLANLLDQPLLKICNGRWNWRERAGDVGMLDHYDFLYSFTSKLLHATPLNLITEKELSASETLTMLDYAFVVAGDLFDEIERFRFDGQADFILIEIGEEEELDSR